MTPIRVLQVDDSDDDANLLCHALVRGGFEVYARRVDTVAGLRHELSTADWDLVIADYTMPGFTGTTALGIVRERHPELPFIFVSSARGEDAAVSAMRAGADDYVTKGNLSRLGPAVERELREAAVRRERQLANQRMAYRAYHDSLTDLPNRALFHDRLQQALLRSHRDEKGLALFVIDLDGFKEINDARGHHAGDLVLQEVAARLRGALRASDTVARLGGDQFAVLLPATDVNRAGLAARKVLHDLEHPIDADGHQLMVSASIGIAGAPAHAATGDELLQKADAAMYLAKSAKCGYQIYNAARDPRVYQGMSMATALRQGLDRQQFEVDYQPIVHLPTGVVIGIESLVRWNHPEHGRLLPDDFIRVAERTGLVNPLTGFVLERALSEWPVSAMPATCGIAVNVSPRSLYHAAFPGRVSELLDTYGTPAGSLTLDLTENMVMSDPDGWARCLHQLHEMGVTLAIDDFGRGYTSLSYLRRLPVDQLKIDRSFLIGLAGGEDATLVRSMIDLAHNLWMQVIAEGVETAGVYQQLVELGCDAVQGYHIFRPAPAAGLARWIEQRQAAG
ncbi:MAG: EAL domain-containing protein [Acidobacteriota bacterium]|nr:EAL domain-containing protein [Acidobacteriota bacterium]